MPKPRSPEANNTLRQRRGGLMPVILKRSPCCKDVFLAVEPIFGNSGSVRKIIQKL